MLGLTSVSKRITNVVRLIAIFGGILVMIGSASASVKLDLSSNTLLIRHEGLSLPVSLRSPEFVLETQTVGGVEPTGFQGDIRGDKPVEINYAPIPIGDGVQIQVKLYVQWFQKEKILRKWASYRMDGTNTPLLVKDIVLEDIDIESSGLQLTSYQPDVFTPYSYPILLKGFYIGIEFPVAITRIENNHAILGHRPGLKIQHGAWHETRKAIYGTAPAGKERITFQNYIDAHRAEPKGFHANYNHWWTTPMRANESNILKIMSVLEEKLYKPYGVSFDAFCLDIGWQNAKSIWEMDKVNFPQGFDNVARAAAKMNTRIGIWMSPSSCYSEALDAEWAHQQGYETMLLPWGPTKLRVTCLGGKKYQIKFKDRMVDMAGQYHLGSMKFDGFLPQCPETDHGHEPGQLSSEVLAEGMIEVLQAIREVDPDVWLRPTCFGLNPSPWWLFYVNSVLGCYEADSPYGRVPCPNYHNSFVSARDNANLQGTYRISLPPAVQEVCDIAYQADQPVADDVVMSVLRGHMFLPFYMNVYMMNDSRWRSVAGAIKWARKNQSVLQDTKPLLPVSYQDGSVPHFSFKEKMPREPYGYAHWKGNKGFLGIRNPWITPATYTLKLDEDLGVPKSAKGLSVVSHYPEARVYGRDLKCGDTLQVHLAPYELVVLSINSRQSVKDLPAYTNCAMKTVKATILHKDIKRVQFDGSEEGMGTDWLSAVGSNSSAVKLDLAARVDVEAPNADLLILLEGKNRADVPICTMKVDGNEVPFTISGSATNWAGTDTAVSENWIFLQTPLSTGHHRVEIDLLTRDESPQISVWAWAHRAGNPEMPAYKDAMPEPEVVSLDSAMIIPPTDADGLDVIHMPRPVEKIDGIFLDALDESIFTVKDGGFVRNNNIGNKPMLVYGRYYKRGLGTLAPSRIAVSLDSKYRRFQSWVGTDLGPACWDESVLGFEVWVDGEKLWESGPVTQYKDPTKWADVDISGARTMELVVVNKSGPEAILFSSFWGDWAEARLLR